MIKLAHPLVGLEELEEIRKVFDSGTLTQGDYVEKFEERVAQHAESSFAVATTSATTGLALVLSAHGIGRGDEVIVPAFSFPATANAVIEIGALPVFADISLPDFNLSISALGSAITPRTRAVIVVHAFGLVADIPAMRNYLSGRDIMLIEDAACALGSSREGVPPGGWGSPAVFSFHPRKIITTGEGGAVTTSDPTLAEKMRRLRSHGATRGSVFFDFVEPGFNFRLSEVAAAIGVVQFDRLSTLLESRMNQAILYRKLLGETNFMSFQDGSGSLFHNVQSFVVLLREEINRDSVIECMRLAGVETTIGTYGLHLQAAFKSSRIQESEFPNASRAHYQSLSLPVGPHLTDSDIEYVVESLVRVVAGL